MPCINNVSALAVAAAAAAALSAATTALSAANFLFSATDRPSDDLLLLPSLDFFEGELGAFSGVLVGF
jgi:hypothetical protein